MTGPLTGPASSWTGFCVPASPKLRANVLFEGRIRSLDCPFCRMAGWGKLTLCGPPANHATGNWLLFTDAGRFVQNRLAAAIAVAYAEAVAGDHVVLFPQMIMKRPGEYMMIAFFQTMFMFGHQPHGKQLIPRRTITWEWARLTWCAARVYDAVGDCTKPCAWEKCSTTMKLGKIVKKAGFRSGECCLRRETSFRIR